MGNFNNFVKEQLKNPDFKKEYDALEPEFAVIQALIDARKKTVSHRRIFLSGQGSHRVISVSWKGGMAIRR